MAGRDITIPFGPDRTGGMDLSSLIPEVEPAQQAEAEFTETGVLPDSAFEAASQQSYVQDEADSAPLAEYPQDEPIHAELDNSDQASSEDVAPVDAEYAEEAEDAVEGAEDEPEEPAAPKIDVQASLLALKDSIDQGRELKAREKERDEFGQKLDADREELTDREDILANYQALVAEQDAIIDECTYQRDARKFELSQLVAQQDETNENLQRMRDYHDSQLQPLETALGRAKATAEQAKNDERSRKSELNAAETEKRKAEGGDDAAMTAARYEVAQQAYEEASSRSSMAKEALDKAQLQYDELREQVEQAEAPLERSLEDLAGKIEELKESVNRLGEDISVARKRRQYCDTVYQYPDETAKLRASVEADEETARRMDEENDELRDRLADSKQRSKTAKFAIAAVILIIIILIVVFVVVGGK